MEKQGIHVAVFSGSVWQTASACKLQKSQKIAVIDGKVAYVGGFNIGKEYIGLDRSSALEGYPSENLRQRSRWTLLRYIQDWDYAARRICLKIRSISSCRKKKPAMSKCKSFPADRTPNSRVSGQLPAADPQGKKEHLYPDAIFLYRMNRSRRHSDGNDVRRGGQSDVPCKPDHPFVCIGRHFPMSAS